MQKYFFLFVIFFSIFFIKADLSFADCIYTENSRMCYPSDCKFFREANTDSHSKLQRHFDKTGQKSLFFEYKRKCLLRNAGETARETTDKVIDTGSKLLDKSGIGEFFKGWSNK